jgi:transmembrane sensor
MKDGPDIAARQAVAEQAALWMLSLQSGKLSPAQRAEFVGWLRESPLHIAEMLRICKLHRHLADYKGWGDMVPLDRAQSARIFHLQARRAGPVGVSTGGRRSAGRLRAALLVAAGMVTLGALGLQILGRLNRSEYRTELGERRELTLPDGSLAQLAPNTDIVVRFAQRERLIEVERGEATFHVAKIPARPFIVRAALTRVLAVGTVFDVERSAQAVSVAVVEGRVAVSQQPAAHLLDLAPKPAVTMLSLGADERVSITLAGVASPVLRLERTGAARFKPGELAFENETVAEVARRFNLHNSVHIDILDSQLGARRVSGVFRDDDPQSFVDFIRVTAEARVAQPDPTHITVSLDGRADSSR